MGEIRFSNIASLCPHCGSKNIVTRTQWRDLDVHSSDLHNYSTKITLDYEGEDYFLYFYKCRDCDTLFCVKRLHTQTD